MLGSISLDMGKIAKGRLSIRIRITGVRAFSLRLKVATAIMRVGAWIMPVPATVEIEDEART